MYPTRHSTANLSDYLRIREELIAAQAEWYWLMRGCRAGSLEEYWQKAESETDEEFLSQIDLGIPS